MSYLNGRSLQVWEKGDGLQATDLNANFAALADRAEQAMSQALTPPPVVVRLEMRLGRIEQRVAALERLTAMHARQRNEKQWAPLSTIGAVLQRVDDLQRAVEEAVVRLQQAHAETLATHDDQGGRLSRVEQRPEAATAEAHEELAALHTETMQRSKTALGEATALRREVEVLTKLATGHDRNANRLEFAPLALAGQLLQRIEKLERAK